MKYRITERGKKLLQAGDMLVELANEAARDGVVSSSELCSLSKLTPIEADTILSILSRLGAIEPASIQGVEYA